MIAEMILRRNYTTEEMMYLGEFTSMDEVYKVGGGFLECVSKDICLDYIKEHSLVKLMKIYWDRFVEERERE
jgi:hypothetical protein